jgi:fatty-acyl-CoA synthase
MTTMTPNPAATTGPVVSPATRGLAAQAARRTVGAALTSAAHRHPDKVALCGDGRRLTFAEVDSTTNRIAHALLTAGGRADRPVAALAQNSVEYALLLLGAAKAGVPVAHLNWRNTAAGLADCLAVLDPDIVFVQDRYHDVLVEATGRPAGGPRRILFPAAGADADWTGFLAGGHDGPVTAAVDPETCLHVVFTSGSTGPPKGAMISHRAMLARAAVIAGDIGATAEDAFVVWSPMYHIAGSDYTYITAMLGGTTFVLPGFDAAAIAEIVASTPIGWLMAIPGMIQPLIDACRRRSEQPGWRPRVRAVGVMPDLIPPAQVVELTGLLDAPFLNSYGMTETGLQPSAAANIPAGVAPSTYSKVQSAFCDIRIVDNGVDVPVGHPGELLFRGATLFSGYLRRPDADAEAFAGGWYHSGDLAVRNEDGTIDFIERMSYMIKSGGENVYPAEIERVLSRHDQVVEAAVVRAPSDRWGQTPVAFVAVRDAGLTPDDLRAWCRAHLSSYQVPSSFRFLDVGDFPRNVSGKVDRRLLERLVNTRPDETEK